MNLHDTPSINIQSNVSVIQTIEGVNVEQENAVLDTRNTSIREHNKRRVKVQKAKRNAVTDEDFAIPEFHEYMKLKECNYKVKFLKEICRHYKQKISGNKHELVVRLYNHLRLSSSIVKIQRVWKKYILCIYNRMRGPGRFNRSLCVNETDFYSMDEITSIPLSQIYTYKDKEGQIYGFDILSLFNLFKKGTSHTTNPYNREPFPTYVRDDLKRLLKLSKVFGDKVDVVIEVPEPIPIGVQLQLRTTELFQEIDNLGNYTDTNWFNNLDRIMLIRFLRELADIWGYRAQLSQEVKREICPPVGDPFRSINLRSLPVLHIEPLKVVALNIIEHMIKRGLTLSSRALGANYVLCALTLVSPEAAASLPWLYQSVAPH
tara:strand:- start:1962 stop:3086 length:1125 start_codon:yes stop_codon:yes gene_type:complete